MGQNLRFFILLAFLTPTVFAQVPAGHHRRQIVTLAKDPGASPVPNQKFIEPKNPVIPFNQWNTNNGYCGEVSFMQANLNQGQWMSQYNARLICGTGLSQSGPDGFCEAHEGSSNYNAQFLLENPNPGDSPFASAGLCLKNAHLAYELYDYAHAKKGIDGYKQYLSWIKAQTIAGHQVTIGVLNQGGSDPEYDHEVSVTKIGTSHAMTDSTYYDDDVLFFDDHSFGGTPYTQGYTFQSLAKTRQDANSFGAHTYSILIPGASPVYSSTGGDGSAENPHAITASNFAFAVSGPTDPDRVTLPVKLEMVGSTSDGQANASQSVIGFNYESPGLSSSCTNEAPKWMGLSLKVTVSGLTIGTPYQLYEYDFSGITGTGEKSALAIPDSRFNAQAGRASHATAFVATSPTYSQTIQTTSDKIIAFRCVKASAP